VYLGFPGGGLKGLLLEGHHLASFVGGKGYDERSLVAVRELEEFDLPVLRKGGHLYNQTSSGTQEKW